MKKMYSHVVRELSHYSPDLKELWAYTATISTFSAKSDSSLASMKLYTKALRVRVRVRFRLISG